MTSLIVVATGPSRNTARAVAAAVAQMGGGSEVIVAHAWSDEDAARRHVVTLAGLPNVSYVDVSGKSPAAALADAVAATTGDRFAVIDGSEGPEPSYVRRAEEALDDLSLSWAGAPGKWWEGERNGLPRRAGAEDLLGSIRPVAVATLIRRSAFENAGGFNQSLEGLALWEFLLRLHARGEHGLLLAAEAGGIDTDDVMLLDELRADRHLPAMRRIFRIHRDLFERHQARVLTDRDRLARRLWLRERQLVERRDRARAELAAAVDQVNALRGELAGHGVATPEWNDLRGTSPVSRYWGLDRGRPIDRYYIDAFLEQHQSDVHGRVLEVLDDGFTKRYGGARVTRADVLDIEPGNRRATVISDLRSGALLEEDAFDCFILTQTLNLIDDMPAAIRQAYRVLKPGGVLLVTLPCVSRRVIEYGEDGDFWRVLPAAALQLFGSVFGSSNIEVRGRGNLLAMTAFLHGLACEDVDEHELALDDDVYPLLVTIRAVKAAAPAVVRRVVRPAAIIRHHRVACVAEDPHALAVTPDVFRAQLEYLARNRTLVSARELAATAVSGDPLDGAVAITFDDGYLDNLRLAAPILQEFNAPATFFFTTEQLGRPRRFWWDVLAGATLFSSSRDMLELRIGGAWWRHPMDTEAARKAAHDALYMRVKRSGPAVRDDILRQLAPYDGSPPDVYGRPMVLDELREMASRPHVEVGAHTVHHLELATVEPDVLFQEVFECRTALERALERPIDLFAYPFGSVSPEAAAIAQSAGYTYAMTCEARPLRRGEIPHRIPRLGQTPSVAGAAFVDWFDRQLATDRVGGR